MAEDKFEFAIGRSRQAYVTSHSTHTGQTLLCQLSATLLLGANEIECSCGAVYASTWLRAMQSHHSLGVVLLLVLFGLHGNLDVLFIEHAHHLGGNFVVNNGLVVLANNVDPEFLEEGKENVVVCVMQFSQVAKDLRQYGCFWVQMVRIQHPLGLAIRCWWKFRLSFWRPWWKSVHMGEKCSPCKHSGDKHLPCLLPYFCKLSAKYFWVEVAIFVTRGHLCIILPPNFYMLVVGKSDVLWDERIVDWVEVEGGELKRWLGRRKGEGRSCCASWVWQCCWVTRLNGDTEPFRPAFSCAPCRAAIPWSYCCWCSTHAATP